MRNLLTFIFFVSAFLVWEQKSFTQTCDHIIDASVLIIDGDEININPGDVVCLNAGNKEFLLLQNIYGTAENPIKFVNHEGAVIIDTDHFYGIKTAHCSFISIMGNGDESIEYGFQIKRVAQGAGISIDELSTDVEIANMEVGNTLIAGLYAKTDPDCSFAASRDNFTMYNLSIHDCYFHNIGDEGFYIGHSKYKEGVYLPDCDTIIYPHLIKGVKVYNNVMEHMGWDGIQVSSSDEDCSIYDNIIRYDSEKETQWQMSGILIGGGSRCDCYNNQIFDGKGDGIDVFGIGGFKVFNNIIVRAGKEFEPNNPSSSKHGIYIGDVVTYSNLNFKLFNNTIVSPKSYGITYNNDFASTSLIYNNLIVEPGNISEGDNAYVNNLSSDNLVDLKNNIYVLNIENAGFKNPVYDSFDLKENSVAIDHGINLSTEGISFDILNRARPYNNFFDVGAYEWQGPDGIHNEVNDIIKLGDVFPNPTNGFAGINIKLSETQIVECRLISSTGIILNSFKYFCKSNKESHINIELNKLENAVYILQFKTNNGIAYRKFIVQN